LQGILHIFFPDKEEEDADIFLANSLQTCEEEQDGAMDHMGTAGAAANCPGRCQRRTGEEEGLAQQDLGHKGRGWAAAMNSPSQDPSRAEEDLLEDRGLRAVEGSRAVPSQPWAAQSPAQHRHRVGTEVTT